MKRMKEFGHEGSFRFGDLRGGSGDGLTLRLEPWLRALGALGSAMVVLVVAWCLARDRAMPVLAQDEPPTHFAPVEGVLDVDFGLADRRPTTRVAMGGRLIFWHVAGRLGIYSSDVKADGRPLSQIAVGHQVAEIERVGDILAMVPRELPWLLLYDISDPTSPRALPPVRTHRPSIYLVSDGTILYAVDTFSTGAGALIERIDIGDPHSPRIDTLQLPGAQKVYGLAAGDGWLAVVTSRDGDRGEVLVFRPEEGRGPDVVFELPVDLACQTPGLGCRPNFARLEIQDRQLMVFDASGVDIFDLSGDDPSHRLASAPLGQHPDARPRAELHEGKLHILEFLPESEGGPATRASVYDLHAPGGPARIGFHDFMKISATDERFDLDDGLVCRRTAFYPPRPPSCWDLTQPVEAIELEPFQLDWIPPRDGATGQGLQHQANLLSLPARGVPASESHFFDLGMGPRLRYRFSLPKLERWARNGNEFYTTADEARLRILEFGADDRPAEIASFCPGGCPPDGAWTGQAFTQIVVEEQRGYLMSSGGTLILVDLSQSHLPTELSRMSMPLPIEGMELIADASRLLLIAAQGQTSVLIDVEDPHSPRMISTLDPRVHGSGLRVSGRLLVGAIDGRVVIHDLEDPDAPRLLGEYPVEGAASVSPVIHGDRIFLARENGIEIVGIQDPSQPRRLGLMMLPEVDRLDVLADGRLVAMPPADRSTTYGRILGEPRALIDPAPPLPTPIGGRASTATSTATLEAGVATRTPVLPPRSTEGRPEVYLPFLLRNG